MNPEKTIRETNELIRLFQKGAATVSSRSLVGKAENWVTNNYDYLVSALSPYPSAGKALEYLRRSVHNRRLLRRLWLKNLRVVAKALGALKIGGTERVFIFDPNKPFTAYRILKNVFSAVKRKILVFDGYVEEGTLDILSAIPKNAELKVLTNNAYGNFLKELPKFKREFPKCEVRKSLVVHDRFFLVGKDGYVSGTSFHSLGGKKVSYVFKVDSGIAQILEKHFLGIWSKAKQL